MTDILLRLIGLQCLMGELCDVAREDKQRAATELLKLEPRINKVMNETFVRLEQVPTDAAGTISILPT